MSVSDDRLHTFLQLPTRTRMEATPSLTQWATRLQNETEVRSPSTNASGTRPPGFPIDSALEAGWTMSWMLG